MPDLSTKFTGALSSEALSPQVAKDRITHLYTHHHATYMEYTMELIESEESLSGEIGDTENTQKLAEDLVQEAFIHAYENGSLFEDPDFNIGAWLRDQIGHAYDRHKGAHENTDSYDQLNDNFDDTEGFGPALALHFNLQASDMDITGDYSLLRHALETVLEHDALPFEALCIEECLKAQDFHKLPATVIPKLTRVLERMQDLPEDKFALILEP